MRVHDFVGNPMRLECRHKQSIANNRVLGMVNCPMMAHIRIRATSTCRKATIIRHSKGETCAPHRCRFHSSVMSSYECHRFHVENHTKTPRVFAKTVRVSMPMAPVRVFRPVTDRNTCAAINTYSVFRCAAAAAAVVDWFFCTHILRPNSM